jgi:Acyltransferase family
MSSLLPGSPPRLRVNVPDRPGLSPRVNVRPRLYAGYAGAAGLAVMDRNRYVDLLRVLAIGGVVYGHWLLVSITYSRGQLSGADAISYVSWASWVTWAFQVMPVFFLVGGYVNARSWPSHRARGDPPSAAGPLQDR